MRIIVIHPDAGVRAELAKWLEESDHVVVESQPSLASWPEALSEHEPDLVLLPESTEGDPELTAIRHSFPDCQIRVVPPDGEERERVLRAAEGDCERRKIKYRGYAAGRRMIFHDDAYRRYASVGKRHRPKNEPGWQKAITQQETLFVLQLQTGLAGGHERAKRYAAVLRRNHSQLLLECAYRLGHGSYKVAWLREELARWLTVICHYIPGADIAACPPPQNASTEFAYLHYTIPATYLYPMFCVLHLHPRHSVMAQILKAVEWSYTGESEEELAETGCRLFGLNVYLAELVRAQLWCMEEFLFADSDFHKKSNAGRGLRRAIGTIMEFWGWDYLREIGSGLDGITRSVLAGTTRVETREGARMVPSFREFRDALIKSRKD